MSVLITLSALIGIICGIITSLGVTSVSNPLASNASMSPRLFFKSLISNKIDESAASLNSNCTGALIMRSFRFAILPLSNILISCKLSSNPSGAFIVLEGSMAPRRSINVNRVNPLASLSTILSAGSAPSLVSMKAAVALK